MRSSIKADLWSLENRCRRLDLFSVSRSGKAFPRTIVNWRGLVPEQRWRASNVWFKSIACQDQLKGHDGCIPAAVSNNSFQPQVESKDILERAKVDRDSNLA